MDMEGDKFLARLTEQMYDTAESMRAPHVLMRPRVFPDGNMWCALLGDDIQTGVVGFGKTPARACHAFDEAWRTAAAAPLPVVEG